MTTLDAAIKTIKEKAIMKRVERVSLEESLGRYCAGRIYARYSFMPHDYSRFDGIALHSEDCRCTGDILVIDDETFAGDEKVKKVDRGAPIAITTGAMLPLGCAAVAKQEEMEWLDSHRVRIKRDYSAGEGVGYKGEVIKENQLIADKGERIDSDMIEKLVMGGIWEVEVFEYLRIGLLVTGSELIDIRQPLRPGKLYPSNGYYLASRLKEMGHPVKSQEIVEDDLRAIKKKIRQMNQSHDLLITTGGIGFGNKDLMHQVVNQLEYKVSFEHIDDRTACQNVIFAEMDEHYILCLSGKTHAMKEAFEEFGRELFSIE